MSDGDAMTIVLSTMTDTATTQPCRSGDLPGALRSVGSEYDDAVRQLRDLVRRAARQQVARMPRVSAELGAVRAEEIIESAADSAAVAVLQRLDSFEGRSRFTTWAYKFGIWHASTEAQRALWGDRPIELDAADDPANSDPLTPESYAEATALSRAVSTASRTVLTPHQRRVALALLVQEVPIDVLAERLGTTRNALYKTLHDARVSLRAELVRHGYLPEPGR